MQNDPQKTAESIEWIKNITRGDLIEKPNWQEQECVNLILRIYRPTLHHGIIKPILNNKGENICGIPNHLDEKVVMFMLSLCDDFIYHEDMCRKLDFIPYIHTIIDQPLALKQVDEAMVNYNYSLGFEVDRQMLNMYIDQQYGFISRYDNALSTCVTIELPYNPPAGTLIKRRKTKIPHHTFLVYKSGSITQSGPGGVLMRDAYYLFMNVISQLKPYIEYGRQLNNKPLYMEYEQLLLQNNHISGLSPESQTPVYIDNM
jgi:hypothetical protein